MLLVLAGLVSVPKYLYEAAEVDRASWWRRFSTITFPYIRSLLLLAVLFRTIETFKLFDVVYIITQGGPGSATETIGVYVYRVAFQNFRTSQSTALAYIVLFVVIVLTSLYLYAVNRRNREADPDGGAARHRQGRAGAGPRSRPHISLIYFFPVFWIILTAFKSRGDTLAVPPVLFFQPIWDNFVNVFYRASITAGAVAGDAVPALLLQFDVHLRHQRAVGAGHRLPRRLRLLALSRSRATTPTCSSS